MVDKVKLINKIQNISLFIICSAIIFILCFFNTQFIVFLGGITKGVVVDKDMDLKNAVVYREKAYDDNFSYKNNFLEIYATYSKLSGVIKLNDVINLGNGMYTRAGNTRLTDEEMDNYAEKVAYLSNKLSENNINFIYYKFPSILVNENIKLPVNVTTNTEQIALKFVDELKERNIKAYNLDYLVQHGDPNEYFFKTDHHWKPETALKAAYEIGDKLIKDYGINIDLEALDINNYNVEHYNEIYLGSHGKRTGKMFTGLDDFSVLIPKFNTHFKRANQSGTVEGDYEAAFLYRSYLTESIYSEGYTYNTYSGPFRWLSVENLNTKSNAKVYLIIDSYSYPLVCFMANAVENLEVIDLRSVGNEASIIDQIIENRPDAVIMQYYAGALANKHFFNNIR